MKKPRKSRPSAAAIILVFLALISIAKIHVLDKITGDSPGEVPLKPKDLVRSDKIGIKLSSQRLTSSGCKITLLTLTLLMETKM